MADVGECLVDEGGLFSCAKREAEEIRTGNKTLSKIFTSDMKLGVPHKGILNLSKGSFPLFC